MLLASDTLAQRARSRVGRPAAATPAPTKTPPVIRISDSNSTPTRPMALQTPDRRRPPLAIEVGTQAAKSGARAFVPERFRNASPEQLKSEAQKLRSAASKVSTGSAEQSRLRELADALEAQLRSGSAPDELISNITLEVSRLRGLPVRQPVRFKTMDREELKQFLRTKLTADLPPTHMQNYEIALKVLGALPQQVDLQQTILGLLSEQIAGLYDNDTRTLYVMKQFDLSRTLARIILAHEICHALQDQNFDFKRLPLNSPDNDDVNVATLSVLEGDATILMQDYARENFSISDLTQLLEVFTIDQRAYEHSPWILRQQLIFPYLSGSSFLLRLTYDDPAMRDEPFRKPPVSSEQIAHPEKYTIADRDDPTSFVLPDLSEHFGGGWKRTFSNVFGEMQIRLLFETWRLWDEAKTVSEGWGGDRYNLYRKGDDYVLVWVTTWDAEQDADEFFKATSDMLRQKVWRDAFGKRNFEGDVFLRSIKRGDTDDSATSAPVLMRFRESGLTAIVELTNNVEAAEALEHVDDELFTPAARALPKSEDVLSTQSVTMENDMQTTSSISISWADEEGTPTLTRSKR